MTWKDYKESLKRGLPPPHVFRMFPFGWVATLLLWWVAMKIVDALRVPRETLCYVVAVTLIFGVLSVPVTFVLLKVFLPKKPPASPSGGGD
jgi:hypothetical protein